MRSSHGFSFSCYVDHRDLHSFPTRRSSDLHEAPTCSCGLWETPLRPPRPSTCSPSMRSPWRRMGAPWRSEEHTSELQSRRDLVCRLLLEKKKLKPQVCPQISLGRETTRLDL